MLLNLYGVQKMVQVLAEHANLGVVFEEERVMPRTDGNTLYVPKPDITWDEDMVTKWLYYIYHELGHNKPEMRDSFEFLEKHKIHIVIETPDGKFIPVFFGMMLNLMDDFRQEYFEYDKYDGQRKVMSLGRRLHYAAGVHVYGKHPGNKEQEALESMFAWDSKCRTDWMPDMVGFEDEIYSRLTPQSKTWYGKLCAGDYESVLKNSKTAEDLYELQKRILKEVFEMDPKKKEEEARAKGKEEEGGEEEGEEAEGEDKEGGEEKKRKGKHSPKEYKVMEYKHIVAHVHERSPEMGHHLDFKDYKPTGITFSPTPINDIKVYDLSKEGYSEYYNGSAKNVEKNILELDSGNGLGNKVKRLLQIRSKDTYQYGQKKGKLHGKNLYRVTMQSAKGFNERVFKNKKVNNMLDVSVSILCDLSTSMRGPKYTHQAKAVIMLNDCLKSLRVPHEIIGFTECISEGRGRKGAEHVIFKSFSSSTTGRDLARDFGKMYNIMYQNADGEHILWAYNRLKKQQTSRKILLVLSDGGPACDRTGDIYDFTLRVVKGIEKEGSVEIYGLGMLYDAVKYFYKDWGVVMDVKELETKLLEVVKSKILS